MNIAPAPSLSPALAAPANTSAQATSDAGARPDHFSQMLQRARQPAKQASATEPAAADTARAQRHAGQQVQASARESGVRSGGRAASADDCDRGAGAKTDVAAPTHGAVSEECLVPALGMPGLQDGQTQALDALSSLAAQVVLPSSDPATVGGGDAAQAQASAPVCGAELAGQATSAALACGLVPPLMQSQANPGAGVDATANIEIGTRSSLADGSQIVASQASEAARGQRPTHNAGAATFGAEALAQTAASDAMRAQQPASAEPLADAAGVALRAPDAEQHGSQPRAPAVGSFSIADLGAAVASGPDLAATQTSPEIAGHEIRTPLHEPEFAPALGAQISLLVKDGVSQARLQLNPAEMGPIMVQIQLDGSQARVEMVAEQAATRQVLEQSMPALAGALRDSGLTLAGGGVFDQSARQQREEAQAGARGSLRPPTTDVGVDMQALAASAPRPGRARGVVDLYA